MVSKADLHRLIDELPDNETEAAARLLGSLNGGKHGHGDSGADWPTGKPRQSLYGVMAKYGPAPSDEDIAAARRELWGSPQREDG